MGFQNKTAVSQLGILLSRGLAAAEQIFSHHNMQNVLFLKLTASKLSKLSLKRSGKAKRNSLAIPRVKT